MGDHQSTDLVGVSGVFLSPTEKELWGPAQAGPATWPTVTVAREGQAGRRLGGAQEEKGNKISPGVGGVCRETNASLAGVELKPQINSLHGGVKQRLLLAVASAVGHNDTSTHASWHNSGKLGGMAGVHTQRCRGSLLRLGCGPVG